MLERRFWPLAVLLGTLMAIVQVLSIREEAQTWDEGMEITSGYGYLTTGRYRIVVDHPPLGRLLAALPLLYFRSSLPAVPTNPDINGTPGMSTVDLSEKFLFQSGVSGDTLVFLARLPMIGVTFCVVLVLAAWVRKRFSAGAAILAVAFFVFDPTVVAHGRYVKNDMLLALAVLVVLVAWEWYLESGGTLALLASGAALGMAISSKFSAAFLVPVLLVLYLIHERRQLSLRHFVRTFVGTGVVSCLVVFVVYAPHTGDLIPRKAVAGEKLLADVVDRSTGFGEGVATIGARYGWRNHPLLVGLTSFASHTRGGHEAYLMGMHSNQGWWYYFPVAFAVKTPAATLAALVLVLVVGLGTLKIREPRFVWFVILVPMAVYLAASMTNRVDIGLRHLLPIYPLLFALLAAGLVETKWRFQAPALALLVTGLAVESLSIFPYYTAFFNVLVGGPKNGPLYLVDSNIDWGQDLKRLGLYAKAHENARLCTCYFGTAPSWYYTPTAGNLLTTDEVRAGKEMDCRFAAVSVTPLEDVYVPAGSFSWLRGVPPTARIGWSIYVWDLSSPPVQSLVASLRGSP